MAGEAKTPAERAAMRMNSMSFMMYAWFLDGLVFVFEIVSDV
jgi:hypothetical protein